MFGEYTYREDVSNFKKITSANADELLTTEKSVVIYIGRETCPYCKKFVKKLSEVSKEINYTIYYVDSSDNTDGTIEAIRDKYNIVTVPGFIVKKKGHINTKCDSSIPKEEILGMIN